MSYVSENACPILHDSAPLMKLLPASPRIHTDEGQLRSTSFFREDNPRVLHNHMVIWCLCVSCDCATKMSCPFAHATSMVVRSTTMKNIMMHGTFYGTFLENLGGGSLFPVFIVTLSFGLKLSCAPQLRVLRDPHTTSQLETSVPRPFSGTSTSEPIPNYEHAIQNLNF